MGFNPAGDSLRKCVECTSDCPTDRCKWALGAHMAKLPGREDRGAVCVGIVCDGKPKGGLRGHGIRHQQELLQCHCPHSTDEEAECWRAYNLPSHTASKCSWYSKRASQSTENPWVTSNRAQERTDSPRDFFVTHTNEISI